LDAEVLCSAPWDGLSDPAMTP